jgi:hypothetical protein
VQLTISAQVTDWLSPSKKLESRGECRCVIPSQILGYFATVTESPGNDHRRLLGAFLFPGNAAVVSDVESTQFEEALAATDNQAGLLKTTHSTPTTCLRSHARG